MPQHSIPVRHHQFDVDDGFGPESDLVSFPASVQRKIDQAAGLLRDGDAREGLSLMREAGIELARADPLLFAGLMAAQMGVMGISVTQAAKTVRTVRMEKFGLGVRYAHACQTTTEESFEERSARFFGGGR